MLGGHDHFGWGRDRHLMASLFDLLALNTQASGQWRKKPPEIEHWPRPGSTPDDVEAPTKKRTTVQDIWMRLKT